MAENDNMELAKAVYEDMCAEFDNRKWSYQRHDEDLVITKAVSGDDIPMEIILAVDPKRQLIRVLSRLPFVAPEDKRMDMAIAACAATYALADGSFDFDLATGKIHFRLTASFRDSKIGKTLFDYLLRCSAYTIDKYNDKFLAICKGVLSIEDFLSQEKGT